jgi:glyceraldehyde-3-phosphate dehydrogenase (NADP+)
VLSEATRLGVASFCSQNNFLKIFARKNKTFTDRRAKRRLPLSCCMEAHATLRKLYIDGQWRTTGREIDVLNPFTGASCGRAALGAEADVLDAIESAAAAFDQVKRTPPFARARLLERIAAEIEVRAGEFAETIVAEAGKPIVFAEAEVQRAIMTFTVASEEARTTPSEMLALDAFPSGAGHFGFTRRVPLGVISAITPFNFPLNLVAHKVAPCLATNNVMVVKPATKTPLTALLLAEVLAASEVPPGQINFVTCDNAAAAPLIQDERVKKITFTGSPAVGWKMKEQCGKKKITLELGGNAGVIVHEDALLATAIPAIAMGAFGFTGQSCISVQRIFVHEPIYDAFRDQLIVQVREKIRTGDPRERSTVVGPMIHEEALTQVRRRIADAVRGGARVTHGGSMHGPCLEATIIENAAAEMEISAAEVFAPVVTLHPYRDFDAALAAVNHSVFGLQAGVFTQDICRAMRAFNELEVGAVLINQVPTWRVENMPYGGVKESGFGREGIRYAMEEMTERRTFIVHLA